MKLLAVSMALAVPVLAAASGAQTTNPDDAAVARAMWMNEHAEATRGPQLGEGNPIS